MYGIERLGGDPKRETLNPKIDATPTPSPARVRTRRRLARDGDGTTSGDGRKMTRARGRGARVGAVTAMGVVALVGSASANDSTPKEGHARGRARAGIAALGYGLTDVQPNVAEKYLPHGAPGWAWTFGAREGLEFECGGSKKPPPPPAQSIRDTASLAGMDPDEYDDGETATADLVDQTEDEAGTSKRFIVRYGTYGSEFDTNTTKYDDAWFENPEHAGDIKWTYGTCEHGAIVRCVPESFGYIDPFPSIADGEPGKKCQWIEASTIPSDHLNGTFTGVDIDANSVEGAVELRVKLTNEKWMQMRFALMPAKKLAQTLKKSFPDTVVHRDLLWNWCADEGEGEDHWCACNTIMRYGWTGNTTLRAPKPSVDADFHKWTIVDARNDMGVTPKLPCNHYKLGGVRPFPLRGDGTRICQCLSNQTLAEYNAALQAVIGGPTVPGQTNLDSENKTHLFNKTHHELDAIFAQRGHAHNSSEERPDLGNAEDEDFFARDRRDQRRIEASLGREVDDEYDPEFVVDADERHQMHVRDVATTLFGVLVVASLTVFLGVAYHRSTAERREYEAVPEPEV